MIEIATLAPLDSDSIADYKIDTSALQSLIKNYPSATLTSGPYPSLNVGAAGGTFYTTNSTYNQPWQNLTMTNNSQQSLNVKGDAEFEGRVKINGQDLGEFMETISKRLAILVPDPEKLEHFEALKKAYNHYKMLEKLCELPKEEKE